jgi:hypothetical protein
MWWSYAMYSRLYPVLPSWQHQPAAAMLRTPAVLSLLKQEPHWWLAQPRRTPFPLTTFAINPHVPLLDNYHTDHAELDLYSEKLIGLLRTASVHFELFPATLVNANTAVPLPAAYHVFHLLEIYPGADMERSAAGPLTLTEACLRAGKPLFRLAECPPIVLIHRDLRAAFGAAGITGCTYQSLHTLQQLFQHPHSGNEEEQQG